MLVTAPAAPGDGRPRKLSLRSIVEPVSHRTVMFDEAPEPIMTPIYDRDRLNAGAVVEGPAIIEQLDSTILVPPGLKAEVDPWLTIAIEVPLAQSHR